MSICIVVPAHGARGGLPPNDACANAMELFPNDPCQYVWATVENATQSMPPQTCFLPGPQVARDVWFKFTATAEEHTFHILHSTDLVANVFFYTGGCDALTDVYCGEDTLGATGFSRLLTTDPGVEYHFRVYNAHAGTTWEEGFSVCVSGPAAPPPNDECISATTLVPTPGSFLAQGTTQNATEDVAPISCDGITSSTSNDVWYAFIATSSFHMVVVEPEGTFDAVVAVHADCSVNEPIACGDLLGEGGPEFVVLDGLTIGQEYRIRVYDNDPGTGTTDHQFRIQVQGPAPPPSNDACPFAIPLGATQPCTYVSGTLHGATEGLLASECDGYTSTTANDTWYMFTPAVGGDHLFQAQGVAWLDLAMEVFPGCGGQGTLECANATGAGDVEEILLPGLQAGVPVYLRIYEVDGPGIDQDFLLCVGPVSAAPPNDACSEAVPLTVHPAFDCPALALTGTTAGAGASDASACEVTISGFKDVWYMFNAEGNTSVSIDLLDMEAAGVRMEVFEGGCDGPSVYCSTFGPSPFEVPVAPGTDHYVRVFTNSDLGPGGPFGICIGADLSTSVPDPVGDRPHLWPLPASNELFLRVPINAGTLQVLIGDLHGRLVRSVPLVLQEGEGALPVGDLAPGAYLLSIRTEGGLRWRERFVVR